MEFNIFTEELKNALVARGIPEETAERHVINLKRSFTPQDLNEIESINSIAEVQKLADSISAIIHKNTQVSVAENSQPQPTLEHDHVGHKDTDKSQIGQQVMS